MHGERKEPAGGRALPNLACSPSRFRATARVKGNGKEIGSREENQAALGALTQSLAPEEGLNQLNLSSHSSTTPFSASSGTSLTRTSSRAPYMRCLLQ